MYYKINFDKLKPDFKKIKKEIPELGYIYFDEVYLNKFENSFNERVNGTSDFDENIIISINKRYFKPLYKVKTECDNTIDTLIEKLLKHFSADDKIMNRDLLFYKCPEFKLYYIISENIRLSYDFLKNINNFYLYDLEFSTIRFYLRQSIEAFVNMYNIIQEVLITKTFSCSTNYFKLCSLYSKAKSDDILEEFKEDLKKSYFYTNNPYFKELIFAKELNDKKSFIPVNSTFFIATKKASKKFKTELNNIRKNNLDDYNFLLELDKIFILFIEELKNIYSSESEFVHVDINNEYLFNYNTFDKEEYFNNLSYELEKLFSTLYLILYYSCFLIGLRFNSIGKNLNLDLKPITEYNSLFDIIFDNLHFVENEDGSCNKNKPLNFSVILNDFD